MGIVSWAKLNTRVRIIGGGLVGCEATIIKEPFGGYGNRPIVRVKIKKVGAQTPERMLNKTTGQFYDRVVPLKRLDPNMTFKSRKRGSNNERI